VNSTSKPGFTLGPIDQLGSSVFFPIPFAYYDKLSARGAAWLTDTHHKSQRPFCASTNDSTNNRPGPVSMMSAAAMS